MSSLRLSQDLLSRLYYETIVPSQAGFLVVFLTLAGSLVIMTDRSPDNNSRLQNVLVIAEVIFPMLGVLVTANLILIEREWQTLEFLAVRHSLTEIWVIRLAIFLIEMHLLLFIELLVLNWLYVDLNSVEMILVASAPALSLVGIASLLGIFSREVNVGYVGAALWWGLCLLSPGMARSVLGRYFFLFYKLFSPETDWLLNKTALFSFGLVLLFMSGLLLRQKERLTV